MSKSVEYNLVGVMLTNGLLIRRGGDWKPIRCWQLPHISTIPHETGYTYTKAHMVDCSDNCVMFGEPVVNEDGTAELTICNNRVLKFRKLFDMRGSDDVEKLVSMTDGDLLESLKESSIGSTLTFNTQKTN